MVQEPRLRKGAMARWREREQLHLRGPGRASCDSQAGVRRYKQPDANDAERQAPLLLAAEPSRVVDSSSIICSTIRTFLYMPKVKTQGLASIPISNQGWPSGSLSPIASTKRLNDSTVGGSARQTRSSFSQMSHDITDHNDLYKNF